MPPLHPALASLALATLPAAQAGWLDELKDIELSDDGDVTLSIGGHTRARLESWSDFNFGLPPGANDSDRFLLWRAVVDADLRIGEDWRVFGAVKSALSTDRDLIGGARPLDVDQLDLHQLFVEHELGLGGDGSVTLRVGRQELRFGKQRLVSPLPWGNTLRTWDALRADVRYGPWSVAGFFSKFVPVDRYDANSADHGHRFYGLYGTRTLRDGDLELDVYALGRELDAAGFNGTAGPEDRYTLGARLGRGPAPGRLDFDVEVAHQLGDIGAQDVSAWMVAGVLGHTFDDVAWNPRAWVGFDYASGDEAAGGDVETFSHLFPLGHAYFGFVDAIGRQNIVDTSLGVSAKPADDVTLGAAVHAFRLADADDALYNAGGGPVVPGGLGAGSDVGHELDLTATWKVDAHTSVLLGYSHLSPEGVVDVGTPGEDVDLAYVQVLFAF